QERSWRRSSKAKPAMTRAADEHINERFPGLDAAKLLAILDGAPARIAFIDRDRRHLYANQEYCRHLDTPAAEIVGRTVAEVLGADSYERLKPFGERALAGETVSWEGWVHYPRTGERFVQRIYKPYVQPNGAIDGYFVMVRDLTDLVRQRDRLHQSE